jgi:hypothetical protein
MQQAKYAKETPKATPKEPPKALPATKAKPVKKKKQPTTNKGSRTKEDSSDEEGQSAAADEHDDEPRADGPRQGKALPAEKVKRYRQSAAAKAVRAKESATLHAPCSLQPTLPSDLRGMAPEVLMAPLQVGSVYMSKKNFQLRVKERTCYQYGEKWTFTTNNSVNIRACCTKDHAKGDTVGSVAAKVIFKQERKDADGDVEVIDFPDGRWIIYQRSTCTRCQAVPALPRKGEEGNLNTAASKGRCTSNSFVCMTLYPLTPLTNFFSTLPLCTKSSTPSPRASSTLLRVSLKWQLRATMHAQS